MSSYQLFIGVYVPVQLRTRCMSFSPIFSEPTYLFSASTFRESVSTIVLGLQMKTLLKEEI